VKPLYQVYLVNAANLPEGVSLATNNEGYCDGNGIVQQDITLGTPGGEATLTLPSGARILNKDKQVLSGSLSITLTHFSPTSDASLQAFPGGLFVKAVLEDQSTANGFFKSAGFVSLEVSDQYGNEAAFLEQKPAKLTGTVPSTLANPQTGQTVAAGDELPLWSFNELSGDWWYDETYTVSATDGGGLAVSGNIWHFSWWNWDWWWWYWSCPDGLKIYFDVYEEYCPCFTIEAEIRDGIDNSLIMRSWFPACTNDPVWLLNMPANYPVKINFTGDCGGMTWESGWEYYDNICDIDDLYFWFYAETTGITVDVDLQGNCNSVNPPVIIRPTLGIWFRATDESCWRWAQMVNGHAQICNVEMGKTYIIEAYAGGEIFSWQVYVNQPGYSFNLELPADVCGIFGY